MARAYGVSEPTGDSGYVEGLRGAVSIALDLGLSAIEHGDRRAQSIPPQLLSQARLAARSNVGLDTVLLRYLAGYTVLGDFVIEAAREDGLLAADDLRGMLRSQASLFERLLSAVTDDYTRELASRPDSTEERRVDCVERLLAGELLDAGELAYEFDNQHVAAIAAGSSVKLLLEVAKGFDCRLLSVCRGDGTAWSWLGAREAIDPGELLQRAAAGWKPGGFLAIGEPAGGLAGWRASHRQARAALAIAKRRRPALARHADVAVLASVLQDEIAVEALRRRYLLPLARNRGGGEVLLHTLRAYLASQRQVSSTAVALGVSRGTVTNRLREIENRLGSSPASLGPEVEVALQLDELCDPL